MKTYNDNATASDTLYVSHINPNGSNDAWVRQTGAILPAPRYCEGMVAVGNTVFVVGGRAIGGVGQTDVWRATFNTSTGTLGAWSTVTDAQLPDGVRYHDVVYSPTARRIYVVGIRRQSDLAISNEAYISSELFAPPPSNAAKNWEMFQ
ncbi:MAG: hypothetical protein V2A74_10230 [bacterium]